jgi:hypothetical protein
VAFPTVDETDQWDGGIATNLFIESLKSQIHKAEQEIDGLECKIQFADLRTTYPHEYAQMRSVQELHRQEILKCAASMQDRTGAEQNGNMDKWLHNDLETGAQGRRTPDSARVYEIGAI